MDTQTVAEKTYALLEQSLGVSKDKITPNAKLADLTADSIQLFEVVLAFEREFNLEAKYEDLIQIITVQDTIEYLVKELAQNPTRA